MDAIAFGHQPADGLFNPLFRAQPLPDALVRLSKARTGIFLVSGLRMPDLLIDVQKQACFLRGVVRRMRDFFDDIVTIRILADTPDWARSSKTMPMELLFSEIDITTTAPSWSEGMQFHLTAYPRLAHGASREVQVRLADLCRAQYLSFDDLLRETGASVAEVCKFLDICKAAHILLACRDDVQIAQKPGGKNTGLLASMRSRFGI
jgi:hypothetical protein